MLALTENDTIHEIPALTFAETNSLGHRLAAQNSQTSMGNVSFGNQHYQGLRNDYDLNSSRTVYWNSYPVYVCTDKTAKAIEILKSLQAEKLLDVKSVPRFIELVEKISGLL